MTSAAKDAVVLTVRPDCQCNEAMTVHVQLPTTAGECHHSASSAYAGDVENAWYGREERIIITSLQINELSKLTKLL